MPKSQKTSNRAKKIYLDYGATTPVDLRVARVMQSFLDKKFANSMSLHSFGQEARSALEQSRATIAETINAKPNEIIFTGSATESNNMALKGLAFANKDKKHIIISSIEHHCVLESAKWLEENGFEITKIPVNEFGVINLEDVKNFIRPETLLVSVIHASNEIGTIQDIEEIGKICREKGVYFHTDASQSLGKTNIDVKKMNIDLMTASSHKIYGPKGAGLLYLKEGIKIEPLLHGGGQEKGLRSSTVNVAAIVGFSRAVEIYKKEGKRENQRLLKLRNKLIKNLLKIEGCHLNGHPKNRLANNVNVRFDFIEGESLIIQLDMKGIACSTGSACSSTSLEPSHVLLATGLKPEQAHGSLRITLGRQTTEKDLDFLIKVLPEIVKKLREISPYGKKN